MTKKKQKPSVYEGKWTPIFEDVPSGMVLLDRAVYGYIRRMEHMDARKCIASASTIAHAIGANEKTIDRSLSRLTEWKIIHCVYQGKTLREPSHYVTNPREEWDEKRITLISTEKSQNKVLARVKLSRDKGQIVQHKGQIDPQRNIKKHIKETKNFSDNKSKAKQEPPVTTPTPVPPPPPPTERPRIQDYTYAYEWEVACELYYAANPEKRPDE